MSLSLSLSQSPAPGPLFDESFGFLPVPSMELCYAYEHPAREPSLLALSELQVYESVLESTGLEDEGESHWSTMSAMASG